MYATKVNSKTYRQGRYADFASRSLNFIQKSVLIPLTCMGRIGPWVPFVGVALILSTFVCSAFIAYKSFRLSQKSNLMSKNVVASTDIATVAQSFSELLLVL